jgi:ribose transport system ATP-binding protein
VPEDRRGRGVIGPMSVRENITLPRSRRTPAWACQSRRRGEPPRRSPTLTVKTLVDRCSVATLSGGNQQKVVLGKWLALRSRVMIFDEPTQGVDVGPSGNPSLDPAAWPTRGQRS